MTKKLARLALVISSIAFSYNSHAGVVGTLSWDGVSDTFTSSENPSVSYVQFGLTTNKSYSDILTLLGTTFSGYHLASATEALTFVNQMVVGSDPFISDGFQATTIAPFADNALGVTDGSRDYYIYGGSTKFGEIFTEGTGGHISFDGNLVSGGLTESQASSFSQRFNEGWLLVSNAAPTTAVPEPSTYAMMGLGLLGLFGISRRQQKHNFY